MKTTSTLIALVAFFGTSITTVSADCYTGGDFWQDKGAARYHAERACRGYDGHQGAFQGTFGGGEKKSACIQFSPTQAIDLSIQNLNGNSAIDLADADCILRLSNEINACDRGGDSTIANWRFIADPNNRIC
ncbi:hypothetical protein HYFRA_00003435 [Hymenoscyphus fraxineus]|uniref:Secreted protein n=1 Tax=Hymenoscyphus fraxineus TaxID=746836 RepID=A0A9N9KXE1_9HELO|nr:hypothetical protein HYFRA_00003435 [Hymenoscyphus fraxineus]